MPFSRTLRTGRHSSASREKGDRDLIRAGWSIWDFGEKRDRPPRAIDGKEFRQTAFTERPECLWTGSAGGRHVKGGFLPYYSAARERTKRVKESSEWQRNIRMSINQDPFCCGGWGSGGLGGISGHFPKSAIMMNS